jgi:hypothetical protein
VLPVGNIRAFYCRTLAESVWSSLWTLSLSDGIILSDQTFESVAPVDERRLSQTMYCEENITAIMIYSITEHMNHVKVRIVLLDRSSGTIIDVSICSCLMPSA